MVSRARFNLLEGRLLCLICRILTFVLVITTVLGPPSSARSVDVKEGEIKAVKHYVFDTIPLNLEELTDAAKIVFSGTCVEVNEIENDPKSKLSVVEFTFNIDEGIKGTGKRKKISFKQWKPTVKEGGYLPGEKYVLFLHGNSTLALTSPVGFLQGQFKILESDKGKFVKNKLDNQGLFENPRSQAKLSLKDKNLTKYLMERSNAGESIGYEQFVSAVRSLVENK